MAHGSSYQNTIFFDSNFSRAAEKGHRSIPWATPWSWEEQARSVSAGNHDALSERFDTKVHCKALRHDRGQSAQLTEEARAQTSQSLNPSPIAVLVPLANWTAFMAVPAPQSAVPPR